MAKKKYLYDTNALLDLGEHAYNSKFAIAEVTFTELEELKYKARDPELQKKLSIANRLLLKNYGEYEVLWESGIDIDGFIERNALVNNRDARIIATAAYSTDKYQLVTSDASMVNICRGRFNIPVLLTSDVDFVVDIEEYTGYKFVQATDKKLIQVYENKNPYKLNINQYLAVKDGDKVKEVLRWTGTDYSRMSYKNVDTVFDKVKPLNFQQKLAFDMMQNPEITIKALTGRYGTGKDYIMIANALSLIMDGKYDKLVWIRNNVIVKDTEDIGALPGSLEEKLEPFTKVLMDQLGGKDGYEFCKDKGYIEVEHLGFARGRTFNRSIVYVSESENLTKEHMQLLIGRIGKGSTLWVNGDYRQTDLVKFKLNNGLISLIERMVGDSHFGYVRLEVVERSDTAQLADRMD